MNIRKRPERVADAPPRGCGDVRYDLPLARLLAGEHLLTIEAVFGTTTIRRDVRFTVE